MQYRANVAFIKPPTIGQKERNFRHFLLKPPKRGIHRLESVTGLRQRS